MRCGRRTGISHYHAATSFHNTHRARALLFTRYATWFCLLPRRTPCARRRRAPPTPGEHTRTCLAPPLPPHTLRATRTEPVMPSVPPLRSLYHPSPLRTTTCFLLHHLPCHCLFAPAFLLPAHGREEEEGRAAFSHQAGRGDPSCSSDSASALVTLCSIVLSLRHAEPLAGRIGFSLLQTLPLHTDMAPDCAHTRTPHHTFLATIPGGPAAIAFL